MKQKINSFNVRFIDFEGNTPLVKYSRENLPTFYIFGAYDNKRLGEIENFLEDLKAEGKLSAPSEKFSDDIANKLLEWVNDGSFNCHLQGYLIKN